MLKFSHMIFYVSDVRETLAFYEKAFGLKTKFLHESNMYGELDTGSTSLGFASNEMAALNLPDGHQKPSLEQAPFANEIAFTSKNVEADYDHAIQSGATALTAPTEKPWGQVVGYLRDPNGIVIEIGSEMG